MRKAQANWMHNAHLRIFGASSLPSLSKSEWKLCLILDNVFNLLHPHIFAYTVSNLHITYPIRRSIPDSSNQHATGTKQTTCTWTSHKLFSLPQLLSHELVHILSCSSLSPLQVCRLSFRCQKNNYFVSIWNPSQEATRQSKEVQTEKSR